jgi:hypothetical protein
VNDRDVTHDKPPGKNKHDVPASPGPEDVRGVGGDGCPRNAVEDEVVTGACGSLVGGRRCVV